MILNFVVENWMSYQEESSLSLIATLERQHKETLTKIPGFRSKKILPLAAIYGGNASGKTGIFKAIAALKALVVNDFGVKGTLPVEPFMCDNETNIKPTTFDITFLVKQKVYRLIVEATKERVIYESLSLIKEKSSVDIYERSQQEEGSFLYDESFFNVSPHVDYVFKSTRENQLFLARALADNVVELSEVYNWFSYTLELVGVGSDVWAFARAIENKEGFLDFASESLSSFDTGVSRLEGQQVGLDSLPPNKELFDRIKNLQPDEVITITKKDVDDYGFEMFTVHNVDSKPDIQKLHTVHVGKDGKKHYFSLEMESSGTQRLMVLLPMLFDLANCENQNESKVYVVDELDRCFHTMLTKKLIEMFLTTCNQDSRKQMLFTTHDLMLMDQSLMRRDEMYISQRDKYGCSELIGLDEFEGIRFDKDLVRSYLDGRFGGIPMFEELK